MRKMLTVFSGAIFALALSFSAVASAVAEEPAQPVDYALSESSWTVKKGVAFGGENMYLTSPNSRAGSKKIGGNSSVKLTTVGNAQATWSYNWILFKCTDDVPNEWAGEHIDGTGAGTGNWLALVYGKSTDSYIAECNDGVITKTKTNWSGNDTWYCCDSTTEITIATTDTEEGVTAQLSFKATGDSHNTGETLTYTYQSANKALWGDYSFTIGTNIGVGADTPITAERTLKYNVEVTDMASDKTAVKPVTLDYALDTEKWTNTDGVAFGAENMYATANAFNPATVPVGGNSSMQVVMDGNVMNGSWMWSKVMLKVNDPAAYGWNHTQTTSSGNWLAVVLRTDSGNLELYECTDGTVAMVASVGVSGYDNWYIHKQVNTIDISAKDTDNGVEVAVGFTASDCKQAGNTNTGNTYSITYSSTNKKLWGSGRVVVGRPNGDGTIDETQTIKCNVKITDKASDYSGDLYAARLADEAINALPAAVNAENYASAKTAYTAANNAYNALTEAQKALCAEGAAAKIAACAEKLAAYEASLGAATVESEIEALPAEINAENYAAAKTAIETAKANYDALTEEQKGQVSNKAKLDAAVEALNAFKQLKDAADAVSEAIAGLPEKVYRDTYADAKTAIEASKAAYDALSAEAKELVGNKAKLDSALAALKAYEDSLSDPVADEKNLAQKKEHWSRTGNAGASNVTFDLYGMKMGTAENTTAMLLDKNIVADSKVELVVDADAYRKQGDWGQIWVMFKNVSDELDAAAPLNATAHGGVAANPRGTWMAFMIGPSYGAKLMICEDGTLTEKNLADTVISGLDWGAALRAINTIGIKTEDLENGVKITLTYRASGFSEVTDTEVSYEWTVENAAFKGNYALSAGTYNGKVGTGVTLSSLKVTGPDGGSGLVDRIIDDGMFNHANSLDYWKAGYNVDCFDFSEKGAVLWDVEKGGLVLNRKIKDKQAFTFEFDNTLTGSGYGNLYIVFKHDRPATVYDGANFPKAEGNYIVLMIGADGFKMFECENGELNATLNTDGSVTGGVELKVPSPATNYDIWNWYKQYLKVTIYTEDVDDGVDVTVTITGGSSGVTFTATYLSENVALHGDSYVGLEYFLGAAGSGNNGQIKLVAAKVADVAEGYVPDIDINALNKTLADAKKVAITAANLAEYQEIYDGAYAKYLAMNYTQSKSFAIADLEALKANLDGYAEDVKTAAALDETIAALPASVNKDNYAAAKSAIEGAKATYDGLGEGGKKLVTKKAQLDACLAALASFESDKDAAANVDALIAALPADITAENYATARAAVEAAENAYAALTAEQKSLVSRYAELTAARTRLDAAAPTPDSGSESGKNSETEAGCGSNAAYAGFAAATVLLAAAVVLIKKKRA